ncbi:MAG: polyketide synthase dehydratase domain-containing protein, partial [Pseudanabaenales cyanobacterium]|nr:polyketide synthase dehydratase domain-containing protein [Pseudanabaenales cyanobacterium]
VLSTILSDKALDFFLLCSSVTAIQGRFGQVDYTGANAFLDAFAHSQISGCACTISVNWDAWQTVGMGAAAVEQLAPSTPTSRAVTYPFFHQCQVDTNQINYLARFDPNHHWLLDEHRLMGKPMLPGTAYLELARAAYTEHTGNSACELREVTFLTPLVIDQAGEIELKVQLQLRGSGFEFIVLSSSADNEQWQEHARGEIASVSAEPLKTHDVKAIATSCQQQILIFEAKTEIHFGAFKYGPRWCTLKQANLGANQGLIQLELSTNYTADLQTYLLHPALLDSAVGFLTSTYDGQHIPFSYKRLRYYAPLTAKLYSHIRTVEPNSAQTHTLRFDVTLLDEQGQTLVEIEDYALRRVEGDLAAPPQSTTVEPENGYLSVASPGQLNTLTYYAASRQPPGEGEVEIEVQATALNFKEVLFALGLIPNPDNLVIKLGIECAGRVARLGKGVEGLAIGDPVIAFGRSCFSPFTITQASLVAPKPPALTFEQAATIPIAFMTAYFSLIHHGRLRAGETVLVHAAAGGVGMAAVQIAQSVGATIIATAGSEEKRDYLRALGIEHVFDSRSLDFAEAVMRCTHGRGVDVVLNSLSGEFMDKSLSVLAKYGRFLELGVRDILSNRSLALGVFEKRLSFFAIQAEPEHPDFTSVWQAVVKQFQAGVFQPLPHRIFAATEVENAFSYMAQAKHIGKLVVSLSDRAIIKTLIGTKQLKQPKKIPQPKSTKSIDIKNKAREALRNHGMSPSEGIEVFERVLAQTLPQIVVSTRSILRPIESERQFPPPTPVSRQNPSPSSSPNRPVALAKNEMEQTIAAIWQEVLELERVKVHDNFFELGGDSLRIVQVRSKLQDVVQGSISTAELFDYPTVSALAAHLSHQQTEEPELEEVHDRNNKQKEALKAMRLKKRRR